MKIKLDENLPVRLAVKLAELGHDTDTVVEEGLALKMTQSYGVPHNQKVVFLSRRTSTSLTFATLFLEHITESCLYVFAIPVEQLWLNVSSAFSVQGRSKNGKAVLW